MLRKRQKKIVKYINRIEIHEKYFLVKLKVNQMFKVNTNKWLQSCSG